MPEFHQTTLPNGLTVLGEVNPDARSVAVGYFVKTGSRDETPELSGCTHFLEHMMFKGTARRSTFDINREFDEIGADNNAQTSHEQTVYWAAVLPEQLPRAVDLLSDMMRPALRPADFDSEKLIILNEISRYLDQPDFDVFDKAMTCYFGGHPLGQSVLGTRESITALTREQMWNYFAARYGASNITVAATGRFRFEQLVELLSGSTSHWERGANGRAYPPQKGSGRVEIHARDPKKVSREHIVLMFAGPSDQDEQRYAADLLTTVVGDRTGSRFYWALVDKGLVEDASMVHSGMDRAGIFEVFLNVAPEQADDALRTVRGILADVQSNGVTEAELEQAKIKLATGVAVSSETPRGRLFPLGSTWLALQEYRTPQQELTAFRAVTTADVRAMLDRWRFDDITTVALGPMEKLST